MKLHERITDALDNSDERDPGIVARKIAMTLSAKEAREIVADLLRDRVRVQIGQCRMADRGSVNVPQGRASRLAASMGNGEFVNGVWTIRAKLTAEDCDWLAEDREKKAGELMGVAEQYRGFAKAIREAGVSTLGELSEREAAVAA